MFDSLCWVLCEGVSRHELNIGLKNEPITKILLSSNNDTDITNIITYLQKYNEIMAKYQLLQPYKQGATRITILDRIVQEAVNVFQVTYGGKKRKTRRKNSRKKKEHTKPKKRRTIKKNHKN